MLGAGGLLLALGALILLAFRGVSVLLAAPLAALLAVVATGGLPPLAAYTQVFMPAAGQFVVSFFPLFLLGAVFGKLMDASGSARAIADAAVRALGPERAVPAVVLSCAVLTYGGVSLFVVAFAVFPIATALFRSAGIPRRLIPAAIALGAFTFTMTALPGTPAIQNAIPMPFFGTTVFAAPGIGVVAAAVMAGSGLAWLSFRARRLRAAGEGFDGDDHAPALGADRRMRNLAHGEAFDLGEIEPRGTEDAPGREPPPVRVAVAPIALVVALNLVFAGVVIPAMDTAYLAEPRFGATTVDSVRGLWAITAALAFTILATIALNARRLPDLKGTLGSGADASVLPIFNTASLVGFGAVVAALPAFAAIREAVLGIGTGNLLVSLAAASGLLAGVTGSASGGMTIALQALGATYAEMAQAAGVSPDLLHRVTAIATGGLDTLPHNGAVITLLGIARLTHREAYGDIFVVAVVGPLLALAAAILLGTAFGGF
jgi:H+/gluconate symporter-like permease